VLLTEFNLSLWYWMAMIEDTKALANILTIL